MGQVQGLSNPGSPGQSDKQELKIKVALPQESVGLRGESPPTPFLLSDHLSCLLPRQFLTNLRASLPPGGFQDDTHFSWTLEASKDDPIFQTLNEVSESVVPFSWYGL